MKFLISCLLFMISFSIHAKVVIGLVDIQKVLVSVKEGKSVQASLKKSFDSKKKLLEKDENKIKKAQESYKKQSAILADSAKMKKEREIQEMVLKLQNKTMSYQKEIQKMEQEMKRPILEKLRPIIDEVSKQSGVAMTFELSAAPIVYAETKKDITESVIQAYDKKYKK